MHLPFTTTKLELETVYDDDMLYDENVKRDETKKVVL